MKIAIAGATGVLGRRLVQQFAERGDLVYGLARSEAGARTVEALGGHPVSAGLFDAEVMAHATGAVDVVVHAATAIPTKMRTSPADWQMNDRIRREGTVALTRYASLVGARRYVQQSIIWVARPRDGSFYDEATPADPQPLIRSAVDGEEIAREAGERYGFHSIVLRFGYFYSADSAHTRQFGEGLLARRLPIMGRGDGLLSIIHVDDAASAVVTGASHEGSGLWHVVDDEPVTAADFFGTFAHKLGAAPPRHVPVWLARLVAGRAAVEMLTVASHTSNARFKAATGWAPRYPTYAIGLDQVISVWRDEGWIPGERLEQPLVA